MSDLPSLCRLILVESRIHRLARYYKTKAQVVRHSLMHMFRRTRSLIPVTVTGTYIQVRRTDGFHFGVIESLTGRGKGLHGLVSDTTACMRLLFHILADSLLTRLRYWRA